MESRPAAVRHKDDLKKVAENQTLKQLLSRRSLISAYRAPTGPGGPAIGASILASAVLLSILTITVSLIAFRYGVSVPHVLAERRIARSTILCPRWWRVDNLYAYNDRDHEADDIVDLTHEIASLKFKVSIGWP